MLRRIPISPLHIQFLFFSTPSSLSLSVLVFRSQTDPKPSSFQLDNMATASVTFLAVMVCTVLTIYLQRCFHLGKMYQQHRCLTPPRLLQKDRILGIGAFIESYRNIRTNTYLSLQQARFEKHGNTYSFKSLGVSVINTIDPENVQAMLAKNSGDFGIGPRRKAAFDPLIGHGIFTADGSEWQAARKLIRPSLNRREIYDVSMFEEHVDRFLRHIPMEGTPVDLQDLFFGFTIDAATEFLFGQSLLTLIGCESVSGKITGADFACAFNRAQRSIADFFALGGLAFLIPQAQFRKDRTVVREFVDHYIKKALSTHSSDENKGADSGKSHGRYQFLQELSKQSADHEALRGGTLHLLLAGRDSTASLLSNMWFMLSRHPHVWKRLQDEIATLKGMKPTYERLKQLQYLRHCINECKFRGQTNPKM